MVLILGMALALGAAVAPSALALPRIPPAGEEGPAEEPPPPPVTPPATPPPMSPVVAPGVQAPQRNLVGPTVGLTSLANATVVRSRSVTTIVTVPAGLPVTNPTEVSILFGFGQRLTQDYNRSIGNKFVYNFPAGNLSARQEQLSISLAERAPAGVVTFPFFVSVPVEARYNVTESPITLRLIHDCDFVGNSEPEIHWADDRGGHKIEYSMEGGEYRTIAVFGRTRTDVRASDNLQMPYVAWDELDVEIPGGFRAYPNSGYGSLLTGPTGSIDFTQFEPDGDQCNAQFHYDLTVTLHTFTTL